VKQTLCPLFIFKHGPPYVHHIAKVKVELRTFVPFDQNTPMFILREKPLSYPKEVWQVDKLLQTLRIIMEGASKDMTNAKSQCKVKQRCKQRYDKCKISMQGEAKVQKCKLFHQDHESIYA
jgi:hypothetical protein